MSFWCFIGSHKWTITKWKPFTKRRECERCGKKQRNYDLAGIFWINNE